MMLAMLATVLRRSQPPRELNPRDVGSRSTGETRTNPCAHGDRDPSNSPSLAQITVPCPT